MLRKFVFLMIGLIVFSLLVSPVGAVRAQERFGEAEVAALAPGLLAWQQVNLDGFGDPAFPSALSMVVFNNQLYAGASNWSGAGASIWRTSNGVNWSPAMTAGFGLAGTNPAVLGMVVFNGQLYAGAGWGGAPGQLWRSSNGTTWNQITGNGLGVDTGGIGAFAVYGNTLYFGTCAGAAGGGGAAGAQIYRSTSGDSLSWTNVVTGGLTTTNNGCVTSLMGFNGLLYAAVENEITGAQIWRSATGNSGSWTQVNTSGFGSSNNDRVGGFAIYNGYLYIGTRNLVTGGQLWRSSNGTNWGSIMTNGFGDVNNDKLESLFVFNGTLYGGLNNSVTGLEVWGSTDGMTWNQVNPDGFGDSNNHTTLWSNETVAFNNSLYMGVANGSGVEIWKRLPIFGDVSSSYWAGSFVERLYSAGITGGCGVNPLQYCPEGIVTRAQMAVFLERGIHGSSYNPPVVGASTGFGDVSTAYWAAAWIKQLAAEGITGGCGSGNYCPENPVTRAQMAVFLLRSKHGASYSPPAAGGSTGFNDVSSTYWAGAWIKQLVTEGITAGCGTGTYCPEAPVTRAQMAVFLVRTFNLP
jgi:S-layer homology domain